MKEKIKGNKIYQCAFAAFIVIAASILFYFMIFRIKEILGICGWIISLFTPFIIGFVFAYLLNPVVKFFKTNIFDKVTKKSKSATNLSILLTTIVFLGLIVLLFSFILPELLKSIETLAVNMPSYFESAKKYLLDALSSREELRTIVLNNYDAINEYITNFFNNKILPNVEELLVKLSDVTCTPNQQLSRLIYSFNATVTEIAKFSVENCIKYHIIDLDKDGNRTHINLKTIPHNNTFPEDHRDRG